MNEGKTVLYMAKKLRMKYSLARRIMKAYKETHGEVSDPKPSPTPSCEPLRLEQPEDDNSKSE